MSIWATATTLGEDDDYKPTDVNGKVRTYPEGFSNAYPEQSDVVWNNATISTAIIPAECVPGWRDEVYENVPGTWLRLTIAAEKAPNYWRITTPPTLRDVFESVVLNEQAVITLRDQLTAWLEQPKVEPRDEVSA